MAKGRERSQKFYFDNEKEVMESLGLKATKGSGSSWIEKEDGENDYILAQLKSTDKESYRIKQLDLDKLEHHALVAHKVPVFLIQFLNNNSIYVLTALENIPKVNEYLNTGEVEKSSEAPLISFEDVKEDTIRVNKIVSSANARDKFYKEKEAQFEKRKWSK